VELADRARPERFIEIHFFSGPALGDSHSDEALERFGRALGQIPEVLEAFLVSGDYDYYLRLTVADTRD